MHPNVAILRRFDPTNLAEADEVLADDFVWHYFNPRLPDIQGDYVGRAGLQNFFLKMRDTTNGTFKVNPVSINTVGDELVVSQVRNSLEFEGSSIEIDAVVVWRILEGQIVEAWDIPAVYHTHSKESHNSENSPQEVQH